MAHTLPCRPASLLAALALAACSSSPVDGRIAIDTGWAERSIRRVAIARNNWNFSGSDDAAVRG
jgi:hypothetical protein